MTTNRSAHARRPRPKLGLEAATTFANPKLSMCSTAGKIAGMLGRCDMLGWRSFTLSACRQESSGVIGDEVFVQKPLVASSSVIVCISGKRKQCDGTLVSLSRRGQKCSKSGFRAMSEAQMIPMLTSTTDQMTAWMPDSGRGIS
jgi:hypothetical protein